jgi:hypothetical protein
MARKKAVPAQIKIRLPEALRRDLEREAAKNNRTLNGEIVYRLTQPFVEADRKAVAEAAAEDVLKRLGPDWEKLLPTPFMQADRKAVAEAAVADVLNSLGPEEVAEAAVDDIRRRLDPEGVDRAEKELLRILTTDLERHGK